MKKNIILPALILFISCSDTKANTDLIIEKNQKNISNIINKGIIEGLPNHQHEIKYKKEESIIFIPCDAQNTEFIFKKTNGKIILEVIEGQDGGEFEVLSTKRIDSKTIKIRVKEGNMKFSYYVQMINEDTAIWTKPETYYYEGADWENKDLDELDLPQKSIRMVSEQAKSKFKTVEEPPCME